MDTREYYVDEILKYAFLLKQDFETDKRKKAEFQKYLQSHPPSWSKQVSDVLPKETEELKQYKGKTIRKRPDGRYWVRFYDKYGKQRSIYGRTQNECLQKLKDALKEQANGEKLSNTITLNEWLEKWLQLYKIGKVKETTVDKLRSFFKSYKVFGDKPISKITSLELQEYFNGITLPRKREQLYSALKDAFTRAYKYKIIKENPFDIVEVKHEKRKPSRALTAEEEKRFIEACKTYPQGKLYLLCLFQGLRLGEALALTASDIDPEKMTLTVSKAINGKSELSSTKTESSNRTMPLFQRTLDILPQNNSGNLFNEYTRGTYQNRMKKLCNKLNLQNISIHSLRHTFATRCAEAGIPAKVVQKWLGHSTVNMTMNVYTHVNDDYDQRMTAKFDTYSDTHSD